MAKGSFKYKQVIVVRADLKMSIGKTAAQVGHAAVTASEKARKERKNWWVGWMDEGQCKIVVKVESEEELRQLKEEAEKLGIPTALIQDRGLTEVAPGTTTCLGLGPAPSDLIDRVTGRLPLLR